jgi:hypothetical protein
MTLFKDAAENLGNKLREKKKRRKELKQQEATMYRDKIYREAMEDFSILKKKRLERMREEAGAVKRRKELFYGRPAFGSAEKPD